MRLDLVVATYQRPGLLAGMLESVFTATRPPELELRVIVVNNDPDTDLSCLSDRLARTPVPLLMLEQPRPGKSHALNLGITMATADYIGFVDDDERLAPTWLQVAYDTLRDGKLDFIGGPMLPIWASEPPRWIPGSYQAVLGIVDSTGTRVPYSPSFHGMLIGGNAIIRRSLFDRVGLYATELGPDRERRLMSCEDEDMYARLIEHGARGEYVPSLIVFHHVHPERVRPAYYRSWCFWNGASKGVLSRRRSVAVARIGGIPRYMFGSAARGVLAWCAALGTGRGRAALLEAELPMWQLTGFIYGRLYLWRMVSTRSGTFERPTPLETDH